MKRLPDGLILVAGGREAVRNNDVNYVFRQRSNFLYLTGIEEPGCYLLLDSKRKLETLFIPKTDTHHRVWLGHVPDANEARELYGIDRVLYNDRLEAELKKSVKGHRSLLLETTAPAGAEIHLNGFESDTEILEDALWELRAVKTPKEIEFLKRASDTSSQAHKKVMAMTRPGMREYQVQAIFESECLRAGLKHLAYPSIVATGRNAAVLHYYRNSAEIKRGDLLVIDAGGEYKGYGADITRTFPVSGKFTPRQKDIYAIVLEAQEDSIRRAKAGITSAELHVNAMRAIAEGLKSLKILKGDTDNLVLDGAVRVFFPHGIGHLLGLDVHDGTGGKKRAFANPTKVQLRFVAKLEPGFVMTIEPGIYFIPALLEDPENRRKFKGVIDFTRAESFLDLGGARIEDDIVIQKSGPPLNLTKVPKKIVDLEALVTKG
ncbi:MAG: aminopeptidase P family protein [Elusimicrobia bacterium]|nr:aminopeptidase P family protein [Elusimicrobiota bacterium]